MTGNFCLTALPPSSCDTFLRHHPNRRRLGSSHIQRRRPVVAERQRLGRRDRRGEGGRGVERDARAPQPMIAVERGDHLHHRRDRPQFPTVEGRVRETQSLVSRDT